MVPIYNFLSGYWICGRFWGGWYKSKKFINLYIHLIWVNVRCSRRKIVSDKKKEKTENTKENGMIALLKRKKILAIVPMRYSKWIDCSGNHKARTWIRVWILNFLKQFDAKALKSGLRKLLFLFQKNRTNLQSKLIKHFPTSIELKFYTQTLRNLFSMKWMCRSGGVPLRWILYIFDTLTDL